ncbi:MAG: glycosyltransferase [Candidatus Krumholzibacteriota bacterium]|nr:glycosyltransferase [Candidatus Krumholzibacteriota bacterium]
MKEKISILIANFNNGVYLRECLNSVINQTSDKWDIIILDDASTDNSREVYKEYENIENISIHYNKQNLGYIGTLKRLIELSENDMVGILDPDDKLDPTCVEKITDYYSKHSKAGFVYTNFWYCDKDMKIEKLGYCKKIPKGRSNIEFDYVSHFKTFRKSSYLKTEGYDESIKYAEDKDLFLKMEEVTHLHFINEPLYFYRVLPESQAHGKKRAIGKENFDLAIRNALKRRGEKDNESVKSKLKDLWKKIRKKKKKININRLPLKKDVGLENLISVKKILNKLNMRFWLTDGTLLGCFRENGFIPHDFDLDIGAFIEDYDDRIIMEFIGNGWELHHIFGKVELGLELSFIRNDVRLDIFFFYEEDGRYWHAAWLDTERGKNLIKYYYDKFELKETEFLGNNFYVPDDTLKYVKTKYGQTWRTPIKNWDWAFGPENSVKTGIYL